MTEPVLSPKQRAAFERLVRRMDEPSVEVCIDLRRQALDRASRRELLRALLRSFRRRDR